MKIEYLFSDTEHKNTISQYTYVPDSKSPKALAIKVDKEINDLEGTNKWILSFTIKGERSQAAKHLSAINDVIMKYEPTVLTNESSAYFNEKIFPKINEFERKLRKYLYLKISLYNEQADEDQKITIEEKKDAENSGKGTQKPKGNKNRMVIYRLETMEFGELYTCLFTDQNVLETFHQKIQSRVSSKAYYLKTLSEIDEKTIWDLIKGNDEIDCIKDNFLVVTDYRNATMHAHNISYKEYLAQVRLFKKVTKFLDSEIGKIIKKPSSAEEIDAIASELYDKTIPEELRSYIGDIEHIDISDQQMRQLATSINKLIPKPFEMPDTVQEQLSRLSGLSKSIIPKPFEIPDPVREQLSRLSNSWLHILPKPFEMFDSAQENSLKLYIPNDNNSEESNDDSDDSNNNEGK